MKTYVMLNHPCDNNANIDFKMTAYQSKIEINISVKATADLDYLGNMQK